MDTSNRWLIFSLTIITLLILAIYAPLFAHEHGRTDPNWEQMSEEERTWIRSLKQPDSPTTSCCGEADQYWCDKVYTRDKKVFCQITDDRDDNQFISPTGTPRPHIPIGTEIEIPPEKYKFEQGGKPIGNPTGHTLIFVSKALYVYCFIQSTGI